MLIKKSILLFSVFFLSFGYAENLKKTSNQEVKNNDVKIENDQKNVSRSTLFSALESALVNNKDIISAQKDLLAIHENYVSTFSAFKPNISAHTEYQVKNTKNWNSAAANPESEATKYKSKVNNKGYGVVVKQNIFKGLADVGALKEVDLSIKAKWSSYEAAKQKVLRDVATYYFEIIAKKEEIAHLKSLLESRKGSVDVATEMHATGAAKYLDVAQANASYSETEARLSKADSEYISLCSKFEELTGFNLPVNLSAPVFLFDSSMSVEQGIDIAMKYNPGIIAASNALLAAKESIKKPNAKIMPSLDASYSFNQSIDTGKKPDHLNNRHRSERGHTVSLGLTIPIYDGGVGRSEKRHYVELAKKSAIEKEKVINETKTEIISTWASMTAAKENLNSAKKAVKARELALYDTEEEHKAGLKITNDVLKAQQELFEAKFIEIQAEKTYFVNQCSAMALVGRMTAKYLKINDSDFDYKMHYSQTKRRL